MRKGTMKVVLTELEDDANKAHIRAATGNTDGSTTPHHPPVIWQDRIAGLQLLRQHWDVQGEKRRRRVGTNTKERFCARACRELAHQMRRQERGEVYDRIQRGHLEAAWNYLYELLPEEHSPQGLAHLMPATS